MQRSQPSNALVRDELDLEPLRGRTSIYPASDNPSSANRVICHTLSCGSGIQLNPNRYPLPFAATERIRFDHPTTPWETRCPASAFPSIDPPDERSSSAAADAAPGPSTCWASWATPARRPTTLTPPWLSSAVARP